MEETNVNTWEEFKKELADLSQQYNGSSIARHNSLLFRGQRKSCWLMRTTLERKSDLVLVREYYRIIGRMAPQIESLTKQVWPIPSYPEAERLSKTYDNNFWCGDFPGYAYMVYLRHHGFPSPFLDWTRSPYVAAFFAFREADEDSTERVAIFVFSAIPNRISGSGVPVVLRYGPYVKTHHRHFLQQSEYTLCLVFDDEWRFERYDTVFEEGLHQQAICRKFTIPVKERRKVLKELDEYNLNALSLFGSEESMMETLETREFFLSGNGGHDAV
jgi:hypothetical protein